MTLISKNGALKDKQSASYVESPTRSDQSAQEVAIGGFAGATIDAFNRLRVSNAVTIFQADERFNVYESINWSTVETASGTSTHDNNKKARILTVTGNGDAVERRTRRYINYVKGKSQTVFFTGNFKGAVANSIKEYGLYDDLNGVFLRLDGTDFKCILRSSVSGSTLEDEASQANFNIDKLDGTGASGVTIDLTKQQVFIIQFGWLGSASIIFSMYNEGQIIPFHAFHRANIIDTLYSQMGTLPIGMKLSSTGAATTMETTCYSVQSEGDDALKGIIRVADTGTSGFSINATPSIPVGIRLNPLYNRASINPIDYTITVQAGNKDIYYRVLFDPALVGDTWQDIPNSIAQGLSGYTSYTGGVVIDSGYVNVGASSKFNVSISDTFLGRDINGVSDVLCIEVQTFSATGSVLFSGKWREDT